MKTGTIQKNSLVVSPGNMIQLEDKHHELIKSQAYSPIDHVKVFHKSSKDYTKKLIKQVKKLEDILKANSPSLIEIVKYDNERQAQLMVALIIDSFLDLSGLNKLKDEQIVFLSEEIVENYGFMTTAEICHVMRNGIKSQYGTIYKEIRIDNVFNWLDQYNEKERPLLSKIFDRLQKKKLEEAEKQQMSSSKNIPCPEHLKIDTTKLLQNKIKKDQEISPSMEYRSLEHYCITNKIEFNKFFEAYKNKWTKEYNTTIKDESGNEIKPDISLEIFILVQSQKLLAEINKR